LACWHTGSVCRWCIYVWNNWLPNFEAEV
jgi:hypothetical protein